MKKAFCMVAMLMALTFAGTAAKAGNIDWDAAAGLSIPFNAGYDLGFGGEATGGLNVGSGLDLTGTIGYYTHGVTGANASYTDIFGDSFSASGSFASLEFLVGIKYKFGKDNVKPYILAQGGISDLMSNITVTETIGGVTGSATGTSASSIYPEIAGGAGVEIGLGPDSKFSLIIQTKVAAVFSTGSSFTYLPITVGVSM